MPSFKEIFAKHGYELFEPESLEAAIIDSLIEKNLRYLYGIPILLEKSKIDYTLLGKLADKENVRKELKEIFFISSKIIEDKRLGGKLKKLSSPIKKTTLDISEFEKAYSDNRLIKEHEGFASDLNYQLSFIFAKKQITILYKTKTGQRLTKTEKEYFSRVIKKKLIAIRELSSFVKEILVKG